MAFRTNTHNTPVGTLHRTVLLTVSLGDVIHQLNELDEMAYQGCELSDKAFDDYELLTRRANQMDLMAESDRIGYLFH